MKFDWIPKENQRVTIGEELILSFEIFNDENVAVKIKEIRDAVPVGFQLLECEKGQVFGRDIVLSENLLPDHRITLFIKVRAKNPGEQKYSPTLIYEIDEEEKSLLGGSIIINVVKTGITAEKEKRTSEGKLLKPLEGERETAEIPRIAGKIRVNEVEIDAWLSPVEKIGKILALRGYIDIKELSELGIDEKTGIPLLESLKEEFQLKEYQNMYYTTKYIKETVENFARKVNESGLPIDQISIPIEVIREELERKEFAIFEGKLYRKEVLTGILSNLLKKRGKITLTLKDSKAVKEILESIGIPSRRIGIYYDPEYYAKTIKIAQKLIPKMNIEEVAKVTQLEREDLKPKIKTYHEKTLKGHEFMVWSVAWSPNGQYIASGSSDETVRIWDVETGKLVKILESHKNWIRSVAWSPNGQYIASGSSDETVRIWDVETGELVSVLRGHTSEVFSVAWSPDGLRIASGSKDKTVGVWKGVYVL